MTLIFKLLDETRTIAPTRRLPLKGKIETGVLKAFTKSFIDIVEIPVFNQVDCWQPYNNTDDINDLHELALYYVRVSSARKPDNTMVRRLTILGMSFQNL